MDHVFARVKRLRKNPIFKIISDHTLYENINVDLDGCVAYIPDHNLDEDCWFKIENFSAHEFCLDFLKMDFISADYDELPRAKFADMAYLFSIQGEDFYFQKVQSSQFIHLKFICLGEVVEIEESQRRLVIKQLPDAIYFKRNDVLVFRDLAGISSIFSGIDVLYREATDQEVGLFLAKPFINAAGLSSEKVSKPNRKRIALAMATLEKMDDAAKDLLFEYIHEYCEGKLAFDQASKKFTISKDEELKQLVYGIEQRFYTTHVSKERRLANSVLAITG